MHLLPVVHKVRNWPNASICIDVSVVGRRPTLLVIDSRKMLDYSETNTNRVQRRREPVLGFPIYVGWSVGAESEKSLCVRFDADA